MDKENIRQEVVQALLWRKREYERHFRKNPKMPLNRTHYAYLGTLRLLWEISADAPPPRVDPEEIRRRAREILENEYGVRRG